MIDDLSHPEVELTIEAIAPVLATAEQLRRAGERMDPMLLALLGHLRRQAFTAEAAGGDQ